MKMTVALFALAGVIFACEKKTEEKTTSAAESVTLPMEVSYKGTPEIGSMKNVQTVMEWNKRFSEMNLDLGDLLADSVTLHLADGIEMSASRDSAVAFVSAYMADMKTIKVIYTAAIPVNMIEPKHEWVFSWTDETYTLKNGNVEHSFFHEDYRLEGGKIREVFQYARKDATEPIAAK